MVLMIERGWKGVFTVLRWLILCPECVHLPRACWHSSPWCGSRVARTCTTQPVPSQAELPRALSAPPRKPVTAFHARLFWRGHEGNAPQVAKSRKSQGTEFVFGEVGEQGPVTVRTRQPLRGTEDQNGKATIPRHVKPVLPICWHFLS